jgi:TolB-like protein
VKVTECGNRPIDKPARDMDQESVVRTQLERMLVSDVFSSAERPKRLLRFLVESALRSGDAPVTEHLIAAHVFHRKSDFDPATDAVVRVEAGRLRHKLRDYYQSDGLKDSVLIELPPRTYAPVFHECPVEVSRPELPQFPPASPSRRRLAILLACAVLAGAALNAIGLGIGRPWIPAAHAKSPNTIGRGNANSGVSIVVLPFSDMSANHDQEYFCDGMVEELIEAFATVPGMRVVSHTSAFNFKKTTDDVRAIGEKLGAGLALEGSVAAYGASVHVATRLVDTADGYVVWSQSYDRELKDVFALRHEIASGIVNSLGARLAEVRGHRPLEE